MTQQAARAPSAGTAKTNPGNFFEDFRLGQRIRHATPRSLSHGDAALYTALYGTRFALHSADAFAERLGLARAPLDDLLVFHTVFGKTVPDISLNAVANLGYADCRFLGFVYPGDTLSATSEIIGLKENANRKTGIVYVRSTGTNQRGETVLTYARWVMVRKRDDAAPAPAPTEPTLPAAVEVGAIAAPAGLDLGGYDIEQAGSPHLWEDYTPGERIDHVDGITIEEAEHQLATRLYQNTARVHFNQYEAAESRFGRRLIYGGHVISLARSLSFNGLANAFRIAAINGGRHVAPCFAGDTVFAWTQVVDKVPLPGRADLGLLRLRSFATKDQPAATFPGVSEGGAYHEAVILDLDYWVMMPRRV